MLVLKVSVSTYDITIQTQQEGFFSCASVYLTPAHTHLSCACTYSVNFCMRLVLVMSFIFAFDQNIEKTRSYKCSPINVYCVHMILVRLVAQCRVCCCCCCSVLILRLLWISNLHVYRFENRRDIEF